MSDRSRKRKFILPTAAEDAAINAGIAADPDTRELSAREFARARRVGRPRAEVTKERITIRLSRDVVGRFRATGAGWQTRLDAALKDWLKTHRPKRAGRM
jgi:uncharacterized protein (DUF4415 family)